MQRTLSVRLRLMLVAMGLAALTLSAMTANELLTNGGIFHRLTFEMYRDVQMLTNALTGPTGPAAADKAALADTARALSGSAAQCVSRMGGGVGQVILGSLGSGEVVDLCQRVAGLAAGLESDLMRPATGTKAAAARLAPLADAIQMLDEPADRLIGRVVVFSRVQLLLMAVLSLALLVQAYFAVIPPLGRLRAAAACFEADRFDTPVTGTGSRDEMGRLARTLEQFRQSVLQRRDEAAAQQASQAEQAAREQRLAEERQTLAEAQASEDRKRAERQAARAAAVERAIADFDAEARAIISRFGAVTEDLVHRTDGLIGTMTRAMEETDAAVGLSRNGAERAQTVAGASTKLSSAIQTIQSRMTHTAAGLERTVDDARRSGERVRDFTTLASQIGRAVTLIEEIAQKTNLLALNATIEAARAGEAGQGFAVVAREVKSLAAQTAGATKEIADMVGGVDAKSEDAVAAISSIVASVEQINASIADIGETVGEQSQTIETITASVQESAQLAERVDGRLDGLRGELQATVGVTGGMGQEAGRMTAMGEDMRTAIDGFFAAVRKAQAG